MVPQDRTCQLDEVVRKYLVENILTNGTAIGNPTIIEFSYLNGEVVHIKGDAMHGTNNTQLNYVKDYFGDCDPTAELNEGNSIIIQTYPNPVKKSLSIT